jgi:hypothetical protein
MGEHKPTTISLGVRFHLQMDVNGKMEIDSPSLDQCGQKRPRLM